jgi:biopolymer transport protein ExbD
MRKIILLISAILVLLSCSSKSKVKATDENKLSVLIFHDSVIVYNGVLEKNTAYKKYLYTEPEKLRDVIELNRLKYGFQSEILVKIALEESEGFADLVQNAIEIAKRNSGPDFKTADITETEQRFFNIVPFKWGFIDSFNKPSPVKLALPKEEDENKIAPGKNSITCILLASDSIYCYPGLNLAAGSFYAVKGNNTFRAFITKEHNRLAGRETIILKPVEAASYASLVALLDEMTINKVSKYSIIKLTEEEKSFFNTKNISLEPPQYAETKADPFAIIQKLPDNNVMLIEIKEDQSVLCKTFTGTGEEHLTKVIQPISENLKKLIAQYDESNKNPDKKYLIVGNKNTDYETFKKVIEALKQNNVYNYKLVTSPE